ncbi:hypothetical protein HGRIS_001981 [Hohenbuehelia grisea]|uniref:SAP domain-containing protein n=1 Tax=Hohenbuehelia grisea TaxID=104357 RepID=A0ABR3JKU8_9AGAR
MTSARLPRHDRCALQKLKYADIQGIARQANIKASGKKVDIIERILAKYPGGIPRKSTPVPMGDKIGKTVLSASRKTSKRSSTRNPAKRKTRAMVADPESSVESEGASASASVPRISPVSDKGDAASGNPLPKR